MIWDDQPRVDIEANMRKLQRNIVNDVEGGPGWSAMGVFGTEGQPPFTYTIGLARNFDHPDLIIYGLPAEVAHHLFRTAIEMIKDGTRFIPGELYADIADKGFKLKAVEHPAGNPLNWASWYYGHEAEAVQLVWPDKAGLYPGEDGFEEDYEGQQDQQTQVEEL